MSLAVVGLGKLGAPLAAMLADSGHDVIGADPDEAKVAALDCGRAPVEEPGLRDLVARNASRLTATTSIADAAAAAEAVFLVVPTPSEPDGRFSLRFALDALEAVGAGIARTDDRRLVVVASTVMPGSTDGPLREQLEQRSGREVGEELGLCYSPEFIALGSVIADMSHPDLILIGESNPWAGLRLGELIDGICENDPPVMRMSIVNAEIAKLAINTFVTAKISYANMLAELCERLPDADAGTVAAAVGLDRRIGTAYLRPGAPYGGPCFPRDNRALASLASELGVGAEIPEATDAVNVRQVDRIASVLERVTPRAARVGILGLAYKPGTTVIDESLGLQLASRLVVGGFEVAVYDSLAAEAARRELGDQVIYAPTLRECVRGAATAVVTTPHPEFKSIVDEADVTLETVLDLWRVVDDTPRLRIIRPGRFLETGESR